jgi:hypothetical protein
MREEEGGGRREEKVGKRTADANQTQTLFAGSCENKSGCTFL